MRTRTRRILTAAAAGYLVLVGYLATVLPLRVVNLLLVTVAVPMVWLIWALARVSAHQHANRYATDVENSQIGRPRPLPHQEVSNR